MRLIGTKQEIPFSIVLIILLILGMLILPEILARCLFTRTFHRWGMYSRVATTVIRVYYAYYDILMRPPFVGDNESSIFGLIRDKECQDFLLNGEVVIAIHRKDNKALIIGSIYRKNLEGAERLLDMDANALADYIPICADKRIAFIIMDTSKIDANKKMEITFNSIRERLDRRIPANE